MTEGSRQSAYRVVVDSSADFAPRAPALWDSGIVRSEATTHVVYRGAPLPAATRCHWRVMTWDEHLQASEWSATALFGTGLHGRWPASWIGFDGPCPLLRTRVELPGDVGHATLYVTARGLVDARINGVPVTDDLLVPGYTDARTRLLYRAYDVTARIVAGPNTLAAVLADGWYAGHVGLAARPAGSRPSLSMVLDVVHDDGRRERLVSDGSWLGSTGPWLSADILMGEHYDARRERPGWDGAGAEDGDWLPVRVDDPPAVVPAPHPGVPVRPLAELPARAVTEPEPGVFVFDLGQNIGGVTRLRIEVPAGTRLALRHGEVLDEAGRLYTANLRRARATDVYVANGKTGGECWRPRFTYHGFRYVEVAGLPSPPSASAAAGVIVHSDTPRTGFFSCSSPLVDALAEAIVWTQRGNSVDVPTDCPQRDERLGWTGDAQLFALTAAYQMDVAAFMTKWLDDLMAAQLADGALPDVAPPSEAVGAGNAGWADAAVVCPWVLFRMYGERAVIARHYGGMARWMECCERQAGRRFRSARTYGDWLAIDERTPKELIVLAYLARSATLMAEMAPIVAPRDVPRWQRLRARAAAEVRRRYLSSAGVSPPTQTAAALVLAFDLAGDDATARTVARQLVRDIEARGGHLSTGFVGTACLMDALTSAAHVDVAYALLEQDGYPSWGYQIRHGATTVWERWDGFRPERGFQDPRMNSFNHPPFGAVGAWLYTTVGGIAPLRPGFGEILLRPRPGGSLSHAMVTYRSIGGTIESRWQRDAREIELDVRVPPGRRARLIVPWEPGRTITAERTDSRVDLPAPRPEPGATGYALDAGRYRFRGPA